MRFLRLPLLACLALCPAVLIAGDAKADDGFVSLFNGKDLTGWVVTTCKAGVENGNLVILDGTGFVRAENQYGDFVLEVEWKSRKVEKSDSGIFFRGEKMKIGKRWPDRYQVNLLAGEEGSLVGNKAAAVKGMAKAGEWNKMKLTCVGDKAELEVNGKPAWKVEKIQPAVGSVGIQCEVPGGGQFEFRNIHIKPLTPPVVPAKE